MTEQKWWHENYDTCPTEDYAYMLRRRPEVWARCERGEHVWMRFFDGGAGCIVCGAKTDVWPLPSEGKMGGWSGSTRWRALLRLPRFWRRSG